MPTCEMTGRVVDKVYPVLIEGVKMLVCEEYVRFGTPVVLSSVHKRMPGEKKQIADVVVSNAGKLIKSAREKRGLKQIDLSRLLNIKESIIHQVEAGSLVPELSVAKKFEEGLGISLITKPQESDVAIGPSKSSSLTIGDLLKK